MTYKFFKNVNSIEELKKQYKKLAFKHHPDRGGNVEDMQTINNEYDDLLQKVKFIHETANGQTYTKETSEDIPDKFKDIINAIIKFNCTIELCGNWLWVFGGYEYKKELKNLGFFFCSRKKAWAWTDTPTKNKHKLTLDEIRRLHGSEIIKEMQEEEKKENKKIEVA